MSNLFEENKVKVSIIWKDQRELMFSLLYLFGCYGLSEGEIKRESFLKTLLDERNIVFDKGLLLELKNEKTLSEEGIKAIKDLFFVEDINHFNHHSWYILSKEKLIDFYNKEKLLYDHKAIILIKEEDWNFNLSRGDGFIIGTMSDSIIILSKKKVIKDKADGKVFLKMFSEIENREVI